MEIEEGQAQVIQHFVNKASTLETTSSLANLIAEATSHPSLFAFSEILSLPNLLQLHGTEDSAYIDLLLLFAMEPCVITKVKETNFTSVLAVDFG